MVSSFHSLYHHTKAQTLNTLWLNYCSSILISLCPDFLINLTILLMSLFCLEIFSEFSLGSLVFLEDHFIFLVLVPTFLSILFPFSLAKLAYSTVSEPFLYFLYYSSYLEFTHISITSSLYRCFQTALRSYLFKGFL